MLVPLLDMPPLILGQQTHAAQAALQFELCIEMRKRAQEIIKQGGIHLSDDKRLELASSVGLPNEATPKVFDRWTRDGDDAPKMLEEVEKDVFILSEHHKTARAFIIASGKMEKASSLAGKRSKRNRFKKK